MKINIKPDNSKSLIKPPISERLKLGCVELAPGENIGEHCADGKEELITVIQGKVTVINDGKSDILHEGQAVYIRPGAKHDVRNDTQEPVIYTYTAVIL